MPNWPKQVSIWPIADWTRGRNDYLRFRNDQVAEVTWIPNVHHGRPEPKMEFDKLRLKALLFKNYAVVWILIWCVWNDHWMVPYKVDILMCIRNLRWPSLQGFVINIGLNGWLFTKFRFFYMDQPVSHNHRTKINIRLMWGSRGHDCIVVGITTICAVSTYHH